MRKSEESGTRSQFVDDDSHSTRSMLYRDKVMMCYGIPYSKRAVFLSQVLTICSHKD